MRIALTCPTYWPYGRRGERYVDGLGRYLAGRGHDVTVITTKPGRPRRGRRNGLAVEYRRELASPLFSYRMRYGLFAWHCYRALAPERFDLVQSLFYTDVFGAALRRRGGAAPVFYVPNAEPFHLGGRLNDWIYRRALRASHRVAPSAYLRERLRQAYGVDSEVIPPGIDVDYFRPVPGGRAAVPTILCMAELVDPRKRVFLLVKAFERLKAYEPEAVLQLSGRAHHPLPRVVLSSVDPRVRRDVRILGVGPEAAVPRLYAEAWVTVLPAVHEAFGMVLVESLAAGTPVVATRGGGIPEVVDDPSVGVLFDDAGPETADSLCEAMRRGLELARDPDTVRRCREHGRRYAWSEVGPRLERLYERLLGEGSA